MVLICTIVCTATPGMTAHRAIEQHCTPHAASHPDAPVR
jgi:hypothetical protein